MSHVAAFQTEAGKPLIENIDALRAAAERLGLSFRKDTCYRWFGRSVGDYPVPAGWRVDDMGRNAEYVLYDKRNAKAYEIGVIPDARNPGCYSIAYDFFASGYGIDALVGAPVRKTRDPDDPNSQDRLIIAPKLIGEYRMEQARRDAARAGDAEVTFVKQADGSYISVSNVNIGRLRI